MSDAYSEEMGDTGLEVTVKMININQDSHHEILNKCPVLKEYSQFIEEIRIHQRNKEHRPYRKAIQECIRKGILKDYLMRRGSEVENMLLAEYDYETDIAVQREEAQEDFARLTDQLLSEGRIEECRRAAKDRAYRKKLIEELL